ncbi:uncharacterized protein A4U43_C07F10920 [Asparagus officinalis]|uniref:DYW domain-containing protein n=1 Tax=Asparagus officinalis TaxID=4686 RepID=A0A5P1EB09_ASPOF|nr:pentatricopeptide repeat-containing protein At5g66520-like [Asparagus officinalis]XP_020273160.1 pentatricopeptide repeat-containing protein At5g66520-like [Asparagus officinalis]ONK63052.1 uncharacterized protein A4U43_C07F10920 [Asparagus officinalis]
MLVPAKTLELKFAMSLIQQSTSLLQLFQLQSLLLKTSLNLNNFVTAKFLRKCLAFSPPKSLPYARALFDHVHAPDTFLYNTLIRAYLQSQNPIESLHLFRRMRLVDGASPDSFSLSLGIQACARSSEKGMGEVIHAHVVKLGFVSDLFIETALIEMYAKIGDIVLARKVFGLMPERDLVAYNVMLAEYVGCGEIGQARILFDEMPIKDLVSWNTMIHGYAKSGEVNSAREIFDRSREKDLVSWSSIISAYAQNKQCNEALRLFKGMQLGGIVPDKVTMVSVLSACADIGALGMGKTIHKFIEKNKIEIDVKLGTSLVDMYAKCGDIENSLQVFHGMDERDVLTWSSMIIGLASHGLGNDALRFFSKMIQEGIKPNDITFVGVLSACNHNGLVDEGRAHFNSMNNVYKISPKVEHYGCMVDLLGRAGHIKQARQLIEDMPFEPDAVVWRALLGSCRTYKNIEIAEEAINNLINLEPYVDGHYVLLSNIYAQANRWADVAEVRKLMRGANIQRIPGSSSIEIGNIVHEFVAGDNSHPRSDEIYKMLAEMIDRLKWAGYEPVTSLVLQDVDEQTKESALIQHSEKLAIAFGLLISVPKSTIRIVKNLRVCEDCHAAIKLISLVYERKLIVRDRNRFHHFADGKCSCGDYW